MSLSIGIIDVLGLTYDPNTIVNFGLGGSESAIIYMAKELQSLGFSVTVYNSCIDSRAMAGVYDGVAYKDLESWNNYASSKHISNPKHDIIISSRSVKPFVDPKFAWCLSSKHRVLWMHDTFCEGDNLIEELVVNGTINDIFTLSDFHTSYATTCNHGKRRNFEVLKNHMFMTRNGVKRHVTNVDVTKKDPYLYVYNASLTKGMLPLVKWIWPEVKRRIPQAKLIVIGGFYRFRDGAEPDAQEVEWNELAKSNIPSESGITFTGVIPQKEIAEILAEATCMLYPGAFPETFGISTLESLSYNTPLITTRFGALEETAIEKSCYLIDYAIEPNFGRPEIDTNAQVKKFVDVVEMVHRNSYLHSQKMQYCNIVHEVSGWDTVALQWKQHFFGKFGQYLPVDEYRKVRKINQRVHTIFGRRFSNPEEWETTRTAPELPIQLVVPFYNGEAYITQCIESIAAQDYGQYRVWLIDDASTDGGYEAARLALSKLSDEVKNKFTLLHKKDNIGAVQNQVECIRKVRPLYTPAPIIMLLDGDDRLAPRNDILQFYNTLYNDGAEFTYGSSWSLADSIPLIAQPYPEEVKQAKSYRAYKFAWGMPYTHLRTFSSRLIDHVKNAEFKDANGNWFRAGGDNALFYTLIEQASPDGVRAVQDITYIYNDLNPINDYKVHAEEQTKTMNAVVMKLQEKGLPPLKWEPKKNVPILKLEPKFIRKVLIAVPTNKYIEADTFKSIYQLDVPADVRVTYQHFHGYNVEQIRNLIADWAMNNKFDYVFFVDSDIVLPQDALVKLLDHNKDIVSGVYVQRIPHREVLELYQEDKHIQYKDIYQKLVQVDGCGFGCVLVKINVLQKMGYPQFHYQHKDVNTILYSEDTFFCQKAREKGFQVWADATIVCDHIGSGVFRPSPPAGEFPG